MYAMVSLLTFLCRGMGKISRGWSDDWIKAMGMTVESRTCRVRVLNIETILVPKNEIGNKLGKLNYMKEI